MGQHARQFSLIVKLPDQTARDQNVAIRSREGIHLICIDDGEQPIPIRPTAGICQREAHERDILIEFLIPHDRIQRGDGHRDGFAHRLLIFFADRFVLDQSAGRVADCRTLPAPDGFTNLARDGGTTADVVGYG